MNRQLFRIEALIVAWGSVVMAHIEGHTLWGLFFTISSMLAAIIYLINIKDGQK